MVRLKAKDMPVSNEIFLKFQFQNGSIKRYNNNLYEFYIRCFNSKMVRLKVPVESAIPAPGKDVSIPKWFD